jgi:Protein of unknown function (DUF4056)
MICNGRAGLRCVPRPNREGSMKPMAAGFPLRKVRGFVVDNTSGVPRAGVTVALEISDERGASLLLGLLTSDHAGYVSFDLSKASTLDVAENLWLTPLAEPTNRLNVLASLAQVAAASDSHGSSLENSEATRMRASDLGSRCLSFILPVSADAASDGACNSPELPAVQGADPCDYRLSPGSFVTTARLRLGDGCCETLAPSVLPVQEYTLRRVVARSSNPDGADRIPVAAVAARGRVNRDDVPNAEPPADFQPVDVTVAPTPPAASISFGEVLEYKQQWFGLGHSLGEIRYSLALAPGEAVEIAVVDWSRQDSVSRTDDITSTEYLANQLNRDRSIGETVDSMLDETQDGWSWAGGTAGAATYSYGTFNMAGDHAVGGTIAHSSGDRNLSADSQQRLHDATNQTTGVIRTLTSTVVMQATQAEQNTLQTRRVANHNHCHALTIEYYEVLRHYRLETAFTMRRKAILVPFAPFDFDWRTALRFRESLTPNLLDASLAGAFNALLRHHYGGSLYEASTLPPATGLAPAPTPTPYFTGHKSLIVEATTPNDEQLFIQAGSTVRMTATGRVKFGADSGSGFDADGNGKSAPHAWYAQGKNEYSLICRVGNAWYQGGTDREFVTETDDHLVLQANDEEGSLGDNWGEWAVELNVIAPASPAPTPMPVTTTQTPADTSAPTRDGDAFAEAVLLEHLYDNRGYYNRIVWLTMDPSDRRMLVQSALKNFPDLADATDCTPLAVSGNVVAFAYDGPVANWADQRADDPDQPLESIVTLPTRGVFAEAMLGHCNACEKRDVTRMWDWTEATTEEPPAITDVTPGPRGTPEGIAQGALPQNVIQIAQPLAEPDPTGLAAALRVIGTPNIFRDMSGLAEVSSLLNTLANGAVTSLSGAQKVAQQAQQKLQAVQGSGAAAGGTTRPTATQTYDNLTAAKEIAKSANELGWTPATTEAVTSGVVSGAGGAQGFFANAFEQAALGTVADGGVPPIADVRQAGGPGVRWGMALGQDWGNHHGALDLAALGGHRYGTGGRVPADPMGYVYTAAAGLIDLGHVRDNVDLLRWVHDQLVVGITSLRLRETDVTVHAIPPGASDRLDLAGAIVFAEGWAHELTTWATPSQDFSSFSPEDLVSNMTGIEIGKRAITAGGAFDASVDTVLEALLTDELEAHPQADTEAALTKIEGSGRWFEMGFLYPTLFRRNFDGTPWPAGMPFDAPASQPWIAMARFEVLFSEFAATVRASVSGGPPLVTAANMHAVTEGLRTSYVAVHPGWDEP